VILAAGQDFARHCADSSWEKLGTAFPPTFAPLCRTASAYARSSWEDLSQLPSPGTAAMRLLPQIQVGKGTMLSSYPNWILFMLFNSLAVLGVVGVKPTPFGGGRALAKRALPPPSRVRRLVRSFWRDVALRIP
jgi:hypothetical protein